MSAAGNGIDTTARTLPVGNLTITFGVVTAGAGSDTAPTTSPVTLSGTEQTLVAPAQGCGKGSYTVSPEFSLAVPANAYRSNFVGAVGSAVNPYVSTITFTIA